MPRKPRVDFPGAWHHVMHRGARKAPVFKKDAHCQLFLDLLENVVHEFELQVHAYSLMSNHYHLLICSIHGNLSRAMKRLNATYTQRVNLAEGWDGPLFRGRFHSELIKDDAYLPYVMAYIHLNPLKAGLITRLQSHAWTSHRAYLGWDDTPWLSTFHFESVFNDPNDLHKYVLDLHRGRIEWPMNMDEVSGWLRSSGEQTVRKIRTSAKTRFLSPEEALIKVRKITGFGSEALLSVERGPRANPARRFAVWALKNGTQLSHEEIGNLLGMSPHQVSHVLRRIDPKDEPMSKWFSNWCAGRE